MKTVKPLPPHSITKPMDSNTIRLGIFADISRHTADIFADIMLTCRNDLLDYIKGPVQYFSMQAVLKECFPLCRSSLSFLRKTHSDFEKNDVTETKAICYSNNQLNC